MGGRTDKVVYRVADSRLKTITITTLQYPSHQPQHSNYDKKKQPYCTQLINHMDSNKNNYDKSTTAKITLLYPSHQPHGQQQEQL
jgi:hypothetical protein